MLNQLLRSFTRAYGRSTGYQAARATGWLVWPLLLAIIVMVIGTELGMVELPFDVPGINQMIQYML